MSKFKKKKSGDLPAISTASLPDIVFMLLFFFMIATKFKNDELLVKNVLPKADQIEKLGKKKPISYIYVGEPNDSRYGDQSRIQLNDKLAEVKDIHTFIATERAALDENLIPFLTVALKVDSDAGMGIVSDIKQELREANALKINYTTKQGDALSN